MRLCIIGLGSIGASIGLAAKANPLWGERVQKALSPFGGEGTGEREGNGSDEGLEVSGYDIDPDTLAAAQAQGVIDRPCNALQACADADLIVLATPPGAMPDCFQALAPHLKPATVLTDVASVKAPVLAWAQASLPYPERFVGGHPIAGTERSGLHAARADLFKDAIWVLTPIPRTDADALQQVEAFVRQLRANPMRMDAQQHDREFALLSFLPHCIAFSLMALQNENPSQLSGGSSWRDATRVAGSDPALWAELLMLNRDALSPLLQRLQTHLQQIHEWLQQGDITALQAFLERHRRV